MSARYLFSSFHTHADLQSGPKK